MAPDRTVVVQRGEERSLLTAQEKGDPMKLTKLEFPQHPRPPQRELRNRGVFDSGGGLLGYVANVYVDEEGNYHFVDVAMGGVMGWLGTKHHLVPVAAIAEGEPGSITLKVDRATLESAPTLGSPHDAPNEKLQRAARTNCGLTAIPPDP
jgi:PRC-barrel domain